MVKKKRFIGWELRFLQINCACFLFSKGGRVEITLDVDIYQFVFNVERNPYYYREENLNRISEIFCFDLWSMLCKKLILDLVA